MTHEEKIRAIDVDAVLAKAEKLDVNHQNDQQAPEETVLPDPVVELETPRAWPDVINERQRQITTEGYSSEHDDEYVNRQLAHSSSDIRLRAKIISHVEMILNHRPPPEGIPFVNAT